jgi:hypothetical protein
MMRFMKAVAGSTVIIMTLSATVLLPARASGQAPSEHLQHVEKQLAEKQAAAEAHRKQMEGIKDPQALNAEMRKHFQMTEDILALMLERRKLTEAQAPKTSSPSAQAPATSQGGTPGGRMGGPPSSMPGGMQREMGGMLGMGGGMMQKEMGGMPGGAPQGGAMPGMGGSASPATPPGTPGAQMADMDQMMKRIAEHSTYMETVKDQATFQQEMLRHQKMLDQMMQLMPR